MDDSPPGTFFSRSTEANVTDQQIIDAILAREGGYVDHPSDRGGPTNYGITIGALAEWRKDPVNLVDVRSLTEAEARRIYLERYISAPGFDHIKDDRLRALVVDFGVNSGPHTATAWLQKSLGVTPDGVIGLKTLGALDSCDASRVYLKLCAARMRFLGRLITDSPSQAVFAAGWMDRVASFVES